MITDRNFAVWCVLKGVNFFLLILIYKISGDMAASCLKYIEGTTL